jgi:pimeloyl-ACP methyl ester carboxylesterase
VHMDPSGTAPVHFERRGHGDPLLLLHGVGLQWQIWLPVLDRLAAERDVIAVDLPGFGLSPPLSHPSVSALTDALVDLLDHLELERPDVAGNSLGGWLALELARRNRARSVVALSPAGFWSRREAAYVRGSLLMTNALARRLADLAPALYSSAVGRTLLGGQLFARPWRIDPADGVRTTRNLVASRGFLPTVELMTADHYRVGPPIVSGTPAVDTARRPRPAQGQDHDAAGRGTPAVLRRSRVGDPDAAPSASGGGCDRRPTHRGADLRGAGASTPNRSFLPSAWPARSRPPVAGARTPPSVASG